MTARERKRRTPGEGSVWSYRTKAGQVRYAIGFTTTAPDGTTHSVTRRRGPAGEKWTTYRDAAKALRDALAKIDKGEWADPSRQPAGAYLDEWAAGLRLGPSTVASYRKNIRLHLRPYLGAVPLRSLTTARIDAVYRELERSGRRDHKGERTGEPLSARTVRYVHTILSAALAAAVDSGRLARNPAATAHPPTAKQAQAPEMQAWTAAQLAAFLAWAQGDGHAHAPAWHVLAHTGMRRGEALALRWRDVDLDAGTVSIRRSAGMIRVAGEPAGVTEGGTKSGKPRVVDIDAATVAVLRAHRKARGAMALQLARDDALVFADHEGRHLQPEHFSRTFADALRRCAKQLAAAPPAIRLHDLRHTHATILLTAGVPVHVVSQRLGHAGPVITLSVYAHVVPGSQRDAAELFGRLVAGAAS
jgi:integrase